jgi:periplasmic copper chaperone A
MKKLVGLMVLGVLAAGCAPAGPPAPVEAPKAQASAVEAPAAKPTITDAWLAATVEGVKVSAGYMTLTNASGVGDRLISATTPVAGRTELHIMETGVGGVMKMRMAEGGVETPAGGTVTFAPGGTHLMLFDLPAPLKDGSVAPVTLTFEKAGAVTVDFAVKPRAAAAGAKPGGHGGH